MYNGGEWGKAFALLLWLSLLGITLGVWKIIDIVIWLAHHLHFTWS